MIQTEVTPSDRRDGICCLCEQVPATTTWGFPVCQPCADFLAELDTNLKAEEAADPDLAEKGRRAEAAFEQHQREIANIQRGTKP